MKKRIIYIAVSLLLVVTAIVGCIYLAIKDNNILWFIPLSTKIEKYKSIIENKVKKYGQCKSILIKKLPVRKKQI